MSSSGLFNMLAPYSKELVALITPLIVALVTRSLQPKAKLVHSIRHAFTYLIQEPLKDDKGNILRPTQGVQVASLSVSNTGRSPAQNIEIVFNWRPQHFNVWPSRHYTSAVHEDGRFSLRLESLAPKEVFGVSLLGVNVNLPDLCNVRSEQVESKQKMMVPQVVQPDWIIRLVAFLMFAGTTATIYVILLLLEWAVH